MWAGLVGREGVLKRRIDPLFVQLIMLEKKYKCCPHRHRSGGYVRNCESMADDHCDDCGASWYERRSTGWSS